MLDVGRISDALEQRADGVWISQRPSSVSYPEEGSDRYREIEESSFWFGHRNACIVAAARAFPPNGVIFDIGGGNGVVSVALEAAGFPAAVMEPSPSGARNARARGLGDVICCGLEEAGIQPGVLPAVGLFDVIEHLEDDVGFLRRVAHHLESNGRVYLTCPAYRALWSTEDEYAGHFRRYTRRTLTRALRSAGFVVEYSTYFFCPLPLPIFAMRTIPSWLGLRDASSREHEAPEHQTQGGWARSLLNRVLRPEVAALERGTALPFGGSCLAIARRAA